MAARFPEAAAVVMDPVEVGMNQCFNELVLAVNRRRVSLLAEYRERREEMRAGEAGRDRTRQQLLETKAQLQEGMVENVLHSFRERITEDIETQLRNLELTGPPVELVFQCDTREVEETISQLGQLIQRVLPPIPNYPALTQPRISVCGEGMGPGQLNSPEGVAYSEASQLIYVADSLSSRVCVFSEEGEYINSFGEGELGLPVGVAISGENVYVSDFYHHAMFHFNLPEFRLVSGVGKEGSGENEFHCPARISVASNGDVFVADYGNNRVVVMDCKLKFKQSIRHSTMTNPYDVKLLNEEVYVLSRADNPCLHVFSKSGSKLHSFITRGKGGDYQVEGGFCFCFDKQSNILIGDSNAIKVFSPAGTLLHTLGDTQEEDKKIIPAVIVLTQNNKIVCTSIFTKFRLHVFC